MIFEKTTLWQRRTFRVAPVILVVAVVLVAADLFLGVFTNPSFLPSLRLFQSDKKTKRVVTEMDQAPIPPSPGESPAPSPAAIGAEPAQRFAFFHDTPLLRTAFAVSADSQSVLDFAAHRNDLDALFPTWFTVSDADGTLRHPAVTAATEALFTHDHLVLPMISNLDDKGTWHPDELAVLLDDPTASLRLIQNLKQQVLNLHADGVNVDFEQLSKNETENFSGWIKRLAAAFHEANLLVTVDIPLNDDAYDYEYLGHEADAVVIMAYDEHYAPGKPGSIAGQSWFTEGIDDMVARVPAAKIIVALGAYGYDWNLTTKEPPAAFGFDEAMILAADMDADVKATGDALNPSFNYQDELKQEQHQVCFLDAVTGWNQFRVACRHQVRGVSMWRLGLEDPGVWDFFRTRDEPSFDPSRLAIARSELSVAFTGEGELLRVRSTPKDGHRDLEFDGRAVDYYAYEVLPHYYIVDRFGHDPRKRIAFTFDDGPDPAWTPEILQVLKQEQAPGTFFLVGDQVQKYPALVRQEYQAGHLLGNHTFFHPNLQDISDSRLSMEINSTGRAIEAITRCGTKLFRAPYDIDTTPTLPAQLRPLRAVSEMGLIIAGVDIDSEDYARPGSDAIVRNVLKHLKPNGPNIVLMHDGGGDRSETVAALRKLLPLLRREGYQFVSIDQLMGVLKPDLMPKISFRESLIVYGSSLISWIRTQGWFILQVLFYATTGISILRILFLGALVLRGPRKPRAVTTTDFTPPVMVLIPAFNEAKVIRRTIDGVLHTDYPDLQVLVVDDGSTDGTAAIVQAYATTHPQVRLLAKTNGGKWSALNEGFLSADRDYIVTIDADTIVPPHTIRELVAPLADPAVDAVCGNVQVGNVHNVLTAFQNVEYVTTQNYDRRAFDALNCISVVPGATGAWRRASVLRAGGYSRETLTEDADLTLTLLAGGARIVYAADARSVTEAPDTPAALFKQRVRWSFGTFQCLWKHRRHAFKGTLGWVAMPNLFLFQVVYPLLSPIGDVVFVMCLLRGDFGAVTTGYLTFLAMDLLGSWVAFWLDHRHPGGLWVVLIQRFYYRQFMYLVAIKSVFLALKGGRQHWNKLDRKASVSLPLGRRRIDAAS